MTTLTILLLAVVASWALTAGVRRLALSAGLIDVPNERSSHAVPTPRGGGLAIVATFVAGLLALDLDQRLPAGVSVGLLGAGVAVALIGLADDRWQLRASWRLAGHVAAAGLLLWHLGTMPPLTVLGRPVALGWFGPPAALLYLAAAINFFNFMDGIDGITALETITVALCGALLNHFVLGQDAAVVPLLLAASVAGFLVWNWPPARIFMGDAGSGFLGLAVAALTLTASFQAPALFWGWFILQGCFIVDATTTLLRRVHRGERALQPHRTHAYQYAARRLGAHRPVTLAYAALTAGWLLPWAAAASLQWIDGLWAILAAWGPLVALAYHFCAGARELQDH